MGQVLINEEHLQNTANAIRTKLGTNETFTPAEFSTAIDGISQENPYPSTGLIIDSFNSQGYPLSVNVVGLKQIPSYYFYELITGDKLFKNIGKNLYLPQDITAINSFAFYNCQKLELDSLPETVTTVGERAFYGCNNLALTKLPNNLNSVGSYGFSNCKNMKITELPDALTSIGMYGFSSNTAITNIKINNTSDILKNTYVFYGCSNLTTVELPDTLTHIGGYCFNGCSKLELNKLPSNLKVLGYYAFQGCNKINITELPESLEELEGAFYGCPLVQINKLPSNLKKLGSYALSNISANISEMPDTITTIGQYACRDNKGITINKLPEALIDLGQYAFNNTDITITKIPRGVKILNGYTFVNCKNITELTIEGPITRFYYSEFNGCTNLKKLVMPRITAVPTFGSSMFSSCGITTSSGEIKVPHHLLSAMQSASSWSSYKNIMSGLDLESIHIENESLNIFNNSVNINILFNGDLSKKALGEYAGYTLEVNGNATIDGDVLTFTEDAKVGDIITVTVTSTYNPEITDTKNLEVIYQPAYYEIGLNDGQWIDSGTTIDDNIVYKSDAGSYNVSNGKSIATITVSGLTLLKLYIRSYAESTYDYTEAFEVDTPAERGKGKFSTRGKQSSSTYTECIYELDGGTHFIDIMYSKDSGGDSSDDRGYFYIGEWE